MIKKFGPIIYVFAFIILGSIGGVVLHYNSDMTLIQSLESVLRFTSFVIVLSYLFLDNILIQGFRKNSRSLAALCFIALVTLGIFVEVFFVKKLEDANLAFALSRGLDLVELMIFEFMRRISSMHHKDM